MKVKFEWNDPPDRIAKKKLGGQPGMLSLATTAARFMDPYVPADNLVLAQNVDITADEDAGYITYNSPMPITSTWVSCMVRISRSLMARS